MSIKKSTFVQDIFDLLVSRLDLKGYNALAAYIGVPYQTLMAWKKRNSIGDYAPFMDKGISKAWLTNGEGEPFPTPADYPHGTAKFRQHADGIQDSLIAETDINRRGGEGYPAQFRPVVESFEILTKGKTTEEVDEIVKGLMRDIWTKYGG